MYIFTYTRLIIFQISIYYANAPRNATVLRSETMIRAVDGYEVARIPIGDDSVDRRDDCARETNVSEH